MAVQAFVLTAVVGELEAGDAFFVQPTKYVGAPELVAMDKRTLVSAWAFGHRHASMQLLLVQVLPLARCCTSSLIAR